MDGITQSAPAISSARADAHEAIGGLRYWLRAASGYATDKPTQQALDMAQRALADVARAVGRLS